MNFPTFAFWALLLAVTPLFPAKAHAGSFNTIYTFTNTCYPSELTLDKNGNLYGAASGQNNPGNIFELSPSPTGWVETVLYSFLGGLDGSNPESGLIFDVAGNLYGATLLGGTWNAGTIFELTPGLTGWTKTTLYVFTGTANGDGYEPLANLTFDARGNLYGSTAFGGAYGTACYVGGFIGCGTVFELSPSKGGWAESSLFSFDAMTDGGFPAIPLLGPDGKLYVTTEEGDKGCCVGGTLVQLTPSSGTWTDKVAIRFTQATGEAPLGQLLLYKKTAYGVTSNYGANGGGTVYSVDLAGHLTVLYSFAQASEPSSGLTLLNNKVYGTTWYGGSFGYGTVYQLTPTGNQWTEQILYNFQAASMGGSSFPGALIADSSGNLYGTTGFGGGSNCGTAFEITP